MDRIVPPPIALDVGVTLIAIVAAEEAGGDSASIPALPGCHTQGESIEEIRHNLREAADGWLAVAHEDALADEAGTPRGIMRDAGLTDDDL